MLTTYPGRNNLSASTPRLTRSRALLELHGTAAAHLGDDTRIECSYAAVIRARKPRNPDTKKVQQMTLLNPVEDASWRQTHESIRRLSYWCSDRSFRGVLDSGLRLRVDVRDSRECRRAARFVTSDTLTDGLTPPSSHTGRPLALCSLVRKSSDTVA